MAFLKRFWAAWKKLALVIANFVARVVLTVFYFTIMLPFALGATLFGDLLGLKNPPVSLWQVRETHPDNLEQARRQF